MYPISLKLAGKKVVVFGGGKVAARKVDRLLEEQALVQVIAPELCVALAEQEAAGKIIWFQSTGQEFLAKVAEQHFALVFVATDSWAVNHELSLQAKASGALVNSATEPEDCDFFVPARISHGDLELTAATGGASPAFARLLRQDLAQRYHEGFGRFLATLGRLRQELQQAEPDTVVRQKLWRQAMSKDVFQLVLEQRLEQAEDEIRRQINCIGAQSSDRTSRDS